MHDGVNDRLGASVYYADDVPDRFAKFRLERLASYFYRVATKHPDDVTAVRR
jgi:hypothetical protein